MRSLSADELLDIWERGLDQSPIERALGFLTAGNPDLPEGTLAGMPIGERDGKLLSLREQVFGPDMETVARCPACSELLETTLSVSDLRVSPSVDPAPLSPLESGGYRVRFRLPDSRDLIAIAGLEDASAAKNLLLERCILEAKNGRVPVPSGDVPGDVLDAVMEAMEASDPQADIRLNLTCPSCGNNWQEHFDILSFFWDEIDNWANHTLDEVHALAMAYGWSESEILSLSTLRRQMYLEKVVE
jgi:hypothetical protein